MNVMDTDRLKDRKGKTGRPIEWLASLKMEYIRTQLLATYTSVEKPNRRLLQSPTFCKVPTEIEIVSSQDGSLSTGSKFISECFRENMSERH